MKELVCNYNELDSNSYAKECLEILLNSIPNLAIVELKGNDFGKKVKTEYAEYFADKGIQIMFKE